MFLAHFAHLDQVNQALDVLFHLLQTAQAVQLRQKFLQAGGRLRLLLGLCGGLRRTLTLSGWGRSVRLGGVGTAGDEVVDVQRGLVALEAVPVAQSQQGVGTVVDKPGLLLADDVVHRSEEQQHQGHQVHKPAGQLSAGHLVAGPHPGEKAGSLETGVVRHRGGQLPEQDGGHRVPLGVHRVVVLHVAGGKGVSVPAPDAQRAGAEKGVRFGSKALAQRSVSDLTPEGGDAVLILLMNRRRGHGTLHQASTPISFMVQQTLYRMGNG